MLWIGRYKIELGKSEHGARCSTLTRLHCRRGDVKRSNNSILSGDEKSGTVLFLPTRDCHSDVKDRRRRGREHRTRRQRQQTQGDRETHLHARIPTIRTSWLSLGTL